MGLILPVANSLTIELEPVVARNLTRHLETADEWYGHDLIPFDRGENFAFLGGRDWQPAQATLPPEVVDALEVLLITKDNLAGFHREFVEHFILEGKWGRWLGRWTAEEHLHAITLREYLIVTRNCDPCANEEVRVAHVMRGYRADGYSQIETLVFMALYERAHAVFTRNLGDKIDEPALRTLVGRICRDESRHAEFFGNLVAHCIEYHRAETIDAIARRAAAFGVVGVDIVEYQDKLRAVAAAGIFDADAAATVVSDLIVAWGVADEPQLEEFARA